MAAKSIFAATAQQSRRVVSLAVGGVAVLLLAGGGGFWYYQRTLASFSTQAPLVTPPPALTAAVEAVPAAVPGEPEVSPTSEPSAGVSAGLMPPAAAAPAQEAAAAPPATPAQARTIAPVEASGEGGDPSAPPAEKVATPPAPPIGETAKAGLVPLIEKTGGEAEAPLEKIQIRRSSPRQTASSKKPEAGEVQPAEVRETSAATHIRLSASGDALSDAYQALSEGRLEDAERLYLSVLAARPHERDALLGLAVIAHRRQQTERATDLYRQVLREDPANVTATSALVNLSVQVDPLAAESRLKQLLDQQPTSPGLYHALGGVLARQKRWGEAQQAFFRAFTLEPGNALYAYNLAVALDRLHKPQAALPYYEKAAASLKPGDVAVDRDTIQRRLQELRTALQGEGM